MEMFLVLSDFISDENKKLCFVSIVISISAMFTSEVVFPGFLKFPVRACAVRLGWVDSRSYLGIILLSRDLISG